MLALCLLAGRAGAKAEVAEQPDEARVVRNTAYYAKRIVQNASVRVGLNVGASAPFGIADNISPLSYSPNFSPVIAFDREFVLWRGLTLSSGIRLEYKGMRTRAKVQYFKTSVRQEDDKGNITQFDGHFTGENITNINMAMATLPLDIGWRFSPRYRLRLGGYISYLLYGSFTGAAQNGYTWTIPEEGATLRQRISITSASFDFSKELRKWDWGVEIASTHRVTDRFFVEAGLAVGVRSIFVEGFKGVSMDMHNMYGCLSLGYQLMPRREKAEKESSSN